MSVRRTGAPRRVWPAWSQAWLAVPLSALACTDPASTTRSHDVVPHSDQASLNAARSMRVHRLVAQPLGHSRPAEVEVPAGADEHYLSARVPGGVHRVRMSAIDAHGGVLAVDEGRDTLDMPRLRGVAAIRRLRVESLDGTPGAVSVYANDAQDRDGDGLGAQLEAALGTCDAIEQPGCGDGPLGAFFRQVEHGTRDSDRDGLDDAEELLGVNGKPPLDLPGWGASPVHKDLFIEADYRRAMDSVQLNPADFGEVAALYAAGSAQDLKNPDGLPGVRLHVDAGFQPTDPTHAGLFGDWGGSNAVDEPDYHRAAREQLTPNRRHRFRYLLVQARGTGQGKVLGDHFTINRNYHRARVFAHELGHTLGLRHHGIDAWGRANCKPNYRSLMNYVYQNEAHVGFATGDALDLDPRLLYERDGLGIDDPSFLQAPPFEFDTVGRAVDWNRNGRIDAQPVRAGLAWATYKSCGELSRGQRALHEGALASTTPALVTLGTRLVALWVDADGALRATSSTVSGPDAQGSCPLGDAIDTACSEWDALHTLPAPFAVSHVAAQALDAQHALLALVDTRGALFLQRLRIAADASLHSEASHAVTGAHVSGGPALVALDVDPSRFGASQLSSVLFRTTDGGLSEALFAALDGVGVIRAMRDDAGRPLRSPFGPSAVRLGTGEVCAALVDAEHFVRLYCYSPEHDGWADVSRSAFYAGLGPRTTSKVGMAFHRDRAADGTTLDPTEQSGSLYLAFTDDADPHYPNIPWLLISEGMGPTHRARTALHFRWQGQLINQWTTLVPGAGVALHEDRSLSALKALLPMATRDGAKLQFLPLADGSYSARLGSGNDFRVIETGICIGLRGRARCE